MEGLDHLDIDLCMNSMSVSGDYVVKPGGISMRDVYKVCRFSNTLLVLPLSGREIRAIMEDNAVTHLSTRVYGGNVYYYTKGDNFTNIIFGGINFAYDMSGPEGERVKIEGFSNGRPFEEDRIYLAVVNNYLLGNASCGLKEYGKEDAIWVQIDETPDEGVQTIIAEYIQDRCAGGSLLLPDHFNWKWSLGYSAGSAVLFRAL